MDDKIRLLIKELGEIRVKLDVDLNDHIQSKLGGPAKAFYIATSQKELIKSIDICRELNLKYLLIGTGSKVAIAPSGFEGLVIKNRNDSIRIFGIKGKVSKFGLGIDEASLEVGSGRSIQSLMKYADDQGLKGLDKLSSLQGTLGGNFYFNSNIQSLVQQVSIYTKNGVIKTRMGTEVDKSDIILSVILRLQAK